MRQFCVFGNPISHSKSPLLHNAVFLQKRLDCFYGRACLDSALSASAQDFKNVPSLYRSFKELGLSGANITIPFKESAFREADCVRGIAKEIGAVNTWILEGEKIIGYNTDAEGFFMCIERFGVKSALILGAGGSAKACASILRAQGIETSIYNRSSARLSAFSDFVCFSPELKNLSILESKCFDIVINTTPAGLKSMQSSDTLPLDLELLTRILSRAHFAFDLVYGAPTPFLSLAKSLGLHTQDGTQMLINQAALSNELFTFKQCAFEDALSIMNALGI
ncbi:shikimate dehydrogenase [Helicobacter himalayensis]|uniref:shikimate dehydrogenase n=1 Tax=Helicobacter himalayensis TaxID=1591088 RepID=UPI00083705F1|nr:shikimate dehydrogenase [Helicobacter himalayensis]